MNDGKVVAGEVLKRYPLARIRIPTLVSSAADDPYKTMGAAKYTAENIPGARFVGLEQGGHLVHRAGEARSIRGHSLPETECRI